MTNLPPPTDDALMKGYDPNVTRRLIGFAEPYRSALVVSLIFMLISSTMSVLLPVFIKQAIDSGLRANSISALRNAVLLSFLAVCIQWGATYIRVNIMARAGQSIIFDIRTRLFEHLQKLSLSFFNRYSVGRIIVRVINDVGVLRDFITWAVLAIARDLFTLIGILIAMLSMNLRLSLLTFLTLPLMVGVTLVFKKYARENYRKVRAAISWVNSVLAENINGVRVVQAFSRQEINFTHFSNEVNRNNLTTNLGAVRIAAAYPSVIDFLGSVAMALVIWLGGAAVLGEGITTWGVSSLHLVC